MLKYIQLTDGLGDKVLIPISDHCPPHFDTLTTESLRFAGLLTEPYNCKTIVKVPLGADEVITYKVRETVDEIRKALDSLLTTHYQ